MGVFGMSYSPKRALSYAAGSVGNRLRRSNLYPMLPQEFNAEARSLP